VTGPDPGMFGVSGTGDTSGYGRLVRQVASPASTPRPTAATSTRWSIGSPRLSRPISMPRSRA
jgi:hypothetical protein